MNLDQTITFATGGLSPPVPPDLRGDYATASDADKAKHRVKYASRLLRWGRIAGGVIGVLLVKGAWDMGLLEELGAGPGTARASEVQQLSGQVAAMRWENRRDKLEAQLRQINAEEIQLLTAKAEANARGQGTPEFISQRLGALTTERTTVQTQLTAMAAAEAEALAESRKKGKGSD